jgi:colanic acid/amylovoran biosynthesis glycosyltransferase
MHDKQLDNLFLFTLSYPYDAGGEKSFLQHELIYLSQSFKTHIIPLTNCGAKENLPNKIILEEGLSEYLTSHKKNNLLKLILSAIFSTWFVKEFISKPDLIFHPHTLVWLIKFNSKALTIYKWMQLFIKDHDLSNQRVILYTYWFNEATTAATWISKENVNFHVITRAHGIDIYEEKYWGYLPYRQLTLSQINSVCLVSKHALDYLTNKYPAFKHKYTLFGLGIKDKGIITPKSDDGNLRIVSCSGIIPIKRVELLLDGLIAFASKYNRHIYWYHIGDGPLKAKLLEKINKAPAPNLKCQLLGNIDNEEVLNFYKSNPVDLFITTSSTEGGRPVSIQEVQSFGIPTIGTNVGGIPEIVNSTNGVLLSDNPTSTEISHAINTLIEDPERMDTMRINARANWEKLFDEKINFPLFVDHLKSL